MKFQVGQRVWRFDPNCRVYAKGADGRSHGSPIYAEHFRPLRVSGVEGRSYLISHGESSATSTYKIGIVKAEKDYRTDDEKADALWMDANRLRVMDAVRRVSVTTLRKIAALLDTREEP